MKMTVFLFGVEVPRRLFSNNVDGNRNGFWRHARRQIARLVAKLGLHQVVARLRHDPIGDLMVGRAGFRLRAGRARTDRDQQGGGRQHGSGEHETA